MNDQTWNFAVVCISVGIAFVQFVGIVMISLIRKGRKNLRHARPAVGHVNQHEQQARHPHRLRESLLEDDRDNDNENQPLLAHVPGRL